MNAADEYICGIARKDLAAEILRQAAADLRRFHGATSAVEREFYLDAYRWLTSDDSSWPFSFLNVCRLLNLAPETVREELVGDMSLGAFRYWTRRCERAASKLLSHVFTNEGDSNSVESHTLARISR
jgi:hypothetical protein